MFKDEIYVETSVWNFLFADDALSKKAITVGLFDELPANSLYISELVLREINKAPIDKKELLLNAINDFKPTVLSEEPGVFDLANEYVKRGIFPEKYLDDAVHIAFASFFGMNVVLSWNFQHIVKVKTRREVRAVNTILGFPVPEIASPEEYIYG